LNIKSIILDGVFRQSTFYTQIGLITFDVRIPIHATKKGQF